MHYTWSHIHTFNFVKNECFVVHIFRRWSVNYSNKISFTGTDVEYAMTTIIQNTLLFSCKRQVYLQNYLFYILFFSRNYDKTEFCLVLWSKNQRTSFICDKLTILLQCFIIFMVHTYRKELRGRGFHFRRRPLGLV